MAEEFLFQEEDEREAWIRFLVAKGMQSGINRLPIEERIGLYFGGWEGEAMGIGGMAAPETVLFQEWALLEGRLKHRV